MTFSNIKDYVITRQRRAKNAVNLNQILTASKASMFILLSCGRQHRADVALLCCIVSRKEIEALPLVHTPGSSWRRDRFQNEIKVNIFKLKTVRILLGNIQEKFRSTTETF